MSGWTDADLARHLAKFPVRSGVATSAPSDHRHVGPERGEDSGRSQPAKRHKFNARKTLTSDGVLCDSGAEARRWADLRLLEQGGAIRDLLPHPSFPLFVNGTRTGRMTFDALYVEDGVLICEDTKSEATRTVTAYRQRVRTFHACYPHITVREHIECSE